MTQSLAVLHSVSLPAMESFARTLAVRLIPGDTITLRGEVGAGKTSFARALIQSIAIDAPDVTSPTFTLMQSYDVALADGKKEILWHLDLYRLEEAQELQALGLEEIWRHIVLIEWPEVAVSMLPKNHLSIMFGFDTASDSRTLTFNGNDAWRKRLSGLL